MIRNPVLDSPLMEFQSIPRLNRIAFSTPIEECDRLRAKIPGSPHIYIKRDDHTDYLVGGNKLRKLEFTMAEALAKGASTILTTGSTHSNHARITAMISKRLGLNCVLVLNGDSSKEAKGNLHISRLLGAEIHLVENRDQRVARMEEVWRELEERGERVYLAPLGCSDEIGSFGLVAAMQEVCSQMAAFPVNFDAIILASSSGGTQAGLEVGKRLFGLDRLQIIGISPDDSSDKIRESIFRIMPPMLHRLGLNSDVEKDELQIDDRYVGKGYGKATEASEDAMRLFCQTEGILLDPFYTSKSAAALIDYCRNQRFSPDSHILFWHTGGLINLFK